jgi:hypothetical protein
MAKYNGSGWHNQSTRHSNARKYGRAGGTYYDGWRHMTSAQRSNAKLERASKEAWRLRDKEDAIRKEKIDFLMKSGLHRREQLEAMDYKTLNDFFKAGLEATGYKHYGQPEREYGFDLTGFKSAEDFEALLKANGLTKHKKVFHSTYNKDISLTKKGDGYYSYSWSNPDGTLELRTGNNPITGVYSVPKQRENEKGYASYMGIKGENDKVEKLAKDIKKRATEIKDEDPKHNGFIW